MFSSRESIVLEVLGTKKLTIKELSYKMFGADDDTPLNAEIITANNISRINKKCKHYSLTWLLTKEKINGKMYVRKIFK